MRDRTNFYYEIEIEPMSQEIGHYINSYVFVKHHIQLILSARVWYSFVRLFDILPLKKEKGHNWLLASSPSKQYFRREQAWVRALKRQ